MRDGFISCARGQISVQFIPTHGAFERGFHRGMLVAEYARGLVTFDEHAMARHSHTFNGNLRFAARQTREQLIGISRGQRNGMRQPNARRRTPRNGRERIENLLPSHVPRAQRRPFSAASKCPAAMSSTAATFSPVST